MYARRLDRFRPREKTAVHSVDNWLGADLSAAEEAPIQAFDGIFASLNTVELEVDVSLGVWI